MMKEVKMKFKNVKIGDFTIRDMLEDIKSRARLKGDYEGDRNVMIDKINYYLNKLTN